MVLGNCGFGFAPVRPAERDRAMLTTSRSEAIGLRDRGALLEGMAADVIVYDLGRIRRTPPHWTRTEIARDQPAGEWRRIRRDAGPPAAPRPLTPWGRAPVEKESLTGIRLPE